MPHIESFSLLLQEASTMPLYRIIQFIATRSLNHATIYNHLVYCYKKPQPCHFIESFSLLLQEALTMPLYRIIQFIAIRSLDHATQNHLVYCYRNPSMPYNLVYVIRYPNHATDRIICCIAIRSLNHATYKIIQFIAIRSLSHATYKIIQSIAVRILEHDDIYRHSSL